MVNMGCRSNISINGYQPGIMQQGTYCTICKHSVPYPYLKREVMYLSYSLRYNEYKMLSCCLKLEGVVELRVTEYWRIYTKKKKLILQMVAFGYKDSFISNI